MNILIMGASGMLGSTLLRYFSMYPELNVAGTIRSPEKRRLFTTQYERNLIDDVDFDNSESIEHILQSLQPTVVINCIGIIKQDKNSEDPIPALKINSLLPHQLSVLCKKYNARLIQISTDCVFSGSKGNYTEADTPDAGDLYGLSKRMGELTTNGTITLRTSIIGHELDSNRSLLNWFLSQENSVQGYSKAIFSGLPTVELARVIKDFVLPNPELFGLYHVSAAPISKYDLLQKIASIYHKEINIEKASDFVIDRSLNSDRFKMATGYQPENWDGLIQLMHEFK